MSWRPSTPRKSLELVSKPSQADEDAGEVDKALVDEAVVFVSNHEAAKAAEPGDGAFDLPAAAVAPEFPAILRVRSDSAAAMWSRLCHSQRTSPLCMSISWIAWEFSICAMM